MATHKKLKVDRFPQLEEKFGVHLSGVTAVAQCVGDGHVESEDLLEIVIRGELIGITDKLPQDLEVIGVAYNAKGEVVAAELFNFGGGLYRVDADKFIGIESFELEFGCASTSHGLPKRVRVYPRPTEDL